MKHIRLPPLGSLRAFAAVAHFKSFKKAAEDIGVTPTAISHQIRILEESLSTAVFVRSAREVTLTAAGLRLQQSTQRAFADLQEAVEAIHHAGQPAALTLTTTSNFLTHWLVPRLAAMKASLPKLDLRLHTSVELVDLQQGSVDVAVRYGMSADPRFDSTLLYEDSFILVANPTLGLHHLDQLTDTTLFHVENRHIPQPPPDWQRWHSLYGPERLNSAAGLYFTDETHAIQAAIAGQGVAIVSSLLARDFIKQGILATPFTQSLTGGKYFFVTTTDKAQRPDVLAFKAWIIESLEDEKAQIPAER